MNRGKCILFAAVGLVTWSCAHAPKPPLVTTLPAPTFRVHDNAEVTKDGVTVTLSPITETTVERFPQIRKQISVSVQKEEVNPLTGQATGRQVTQDVQFPATIVPVPSFQVRIVNNTGHVIRLSEAVFRLEDNTGKKYPLFATTAELVAWCEASVAATLPAERELQVQIMDQVRASLNSLQLLNKSVELLKGDEWSGFLVFNLPTGTKKEYDALVAHVERLKVRLAEIPVETDEAGSVSRTTEFSFVLDKATEDVDVECPADSEPSWDVCKRPG